MYARGMYFAERVYGNIICFLGGPGLNYVLLIAGSATNIVTFLELWKKVLLFDKLLIKIFFIFNDYNYV